MTHICIDKLTITGSDNSFSPERCQAIIRSKAGILSIQTLGTNFSEILSKTDSFSVKKMHSKMSSGKWRPFFLGLNVSIINRTPATALTPYCNTLLWLSHQCGIIITKYWKQNLQWFVIIACADSNGTQTLTDVNDWYKWLSSQLIRSPISPSREETQLYWYAFLD